jgi:hypothetical protein
MHDGRILLVGGDTCHCRAKSFRNGEERMSRWFELGQHLASGTTKITERGAMGVQICCGMLDKG